MWPRARALPAGRWPSAAGRSCCPTCPTMSSRCSPTPAGAVAWEMPHRAPDSLGLPFADALPAAADRLARARSEGRYARHDDIVALYRITGGEGTAYGLWTMVDTDQISTSADEPG